MEICLHYMEKCYFYVFFLVSITFFLIFQHFTNYNTLFFELQDNFSKSPQHFSIFLLLFFVQNKTFCNLYKSMLEYLIELLLIKTRKSRKPI